MAEQNVAYLGRGVLLGCEEEWGMVKVILWVHPEVIMQSYRSQTKLMKDIWLFRRILRGQRTKSSRLWLSRARGSDGNTWKRFPDSDEVPSEGNENSLEPESNASLSFWSLAKTLHSLPHHFPGCSSSWRPPFSQLSSCL